MTTLPSPVRLDRSPCGGARSVQRLGEALSTTAVDIASRYFQWLGSQLWGSVRAECVAPGRYDLKLLGIRTIALSIAVETDKVARFEVTGGALAKAGKGVFEFRMVGEAPTTFAILDAFHPRLPWWVYARTQARLHAWLMERFARSLTPKPGPQP